MSDVRNCFSCPEPNPATHIATVPHKDGNGKVAFGAPLCPSHSNFALVAGWIPVHTIGSTEGAKLWTEHGYGNTSLKDSSHE